MVFAKNSSLCKKEKDKKLVKKPTYNPDKMSQLKTKFDIQKNNNQSSSIFVKMKSLKS